MKLKKKNVYLASGAIVSAAIAGLVSGSAHASSFTSDGVRGTTQLNPAAGVQAPFAAETDAGKHDCKGKNECKGHGGCKTGDNGCKGKNSCKGHGGCASK